MTREQKDSSFGEFVKPITLSKASDVVDQTSHDYEALKDYRYYSGPKTRDIGAELMFKLIAEQLGIFIALVSAYVVYARFARPKPTSEQIALVHGALWRLAEPADIAMVHAAAEPYGNRKLSLGVVAKTLDFLARNSRATFELREKVYRDGHSRSVRYCSLRDRDEEPPPCPPPRRDVGSPAARSRRETGMGSSDESYGHARSSSRFEVKPFPGHRARVSR